MIHYLEAYMTGGNGVTRMKHGQRGFLHCILAGMEGGIRLVWLGDPVSCLPVRQDAMAYLI